MNNKDKTKQPEERMGGRNSAMSTEPRLLCHPGTEAAWVHRSVTPPYSQLSNVRQEGS